MEDLTTPINVHKSPVLMLSQNICTYQNKAMKKGTLSLSLI